MGLGPFFILLRSEDTNYSNARYQIAAILALAYCLESVPLGTQYW